MCAMFFNSSAQIDKRLQCPDCDIDMFFLGSRPTRRVFLSAILERRFFLCPNCGRLSHSVVSTSQASYDPQSVSDLGEDVRRARELPNVRQYSLEHGWIGSRDKRR